MYIGTHQLTLKWTQIMTKIELWFKRIKLPSKKYYNELKSRILKIPEKMY